MEKKVDIDLLYKKIKEKNMSLNSLAKITNISAGYLCMMLNNKRTMTVDRLNKILQATNININDITK